MKEFIKDEENILVNSPYMEAYIFKDLFAKDDPKESAIAYVYGEGYRLIGEFNVRVFPDAPNEDDDMIALREKYPLRTFNYPNMITTYPSSVEEVTMKVTPDMEPDKVLIFKYDKGDIMMESKIKQDISNCEKYLNMICSGKIPTSIPYKDLIKIWERNFTINGQTPGVPAATREALIATLCRDKSNPLKPYRMISGKKADYDQFGYMACNMRQATSFTNVLCALTFEDMGSMLVSSINMSRSGTKQAESPFEKILSM